MISEALVVSGGLGSAVFFTVELRMRARWSGQSIDTMLVGSPYRAFTVPTRVSDRAPALVRAAALSGILLGCVAVPGAAYAMATLSFDGIALSLLPSIASAAAAWLAGWLLLSRAPVAVEAANHAAGLSTMAHVVLLVIALLHVVAARVGYTDRDSLGYVVVSGALALAALPQAALLKVAARRHASAFGVRHRGHSPLYSVAMSPGGMIDSNPPPPPGGD
jgi:hypothetical protein